jgi:hypothetical protein
MIKHFPRTMSGLLAVCFCLSHGALVFGSSASKPTVQARAVSDTFATSPILDLQPSAVRDATVSLKPKPSDNARTAKAAKKSFVRLSSTRRSNRRFAHHKLAMRAVPDDCDACHQTCLVGGLTCIAISITTGCLPCGVICVAGQVACQAVCNTTTSCLREIPEQPLVN